MANQPGFSRCCPYTNVRACYSVGTIFAYHDVVDVLCERDLTGRQTEGTKAHARTRIETKQ